MNEDENTITDIRKTILLVEDDAIIALTCRKNLEKQGYMAIVTNTGEKAAEIIERNHAIDLILMDIDLGKGIDGTEAAEIILRSHDIPIVFLSSHTEPEIVEKTEKITSYGYVVKNSSFTVLDASIKMAFKLFDANRKMENSEKKYRFLASNIPDIIYSLDKAGKIITINSLTFQNYGYSEQESIGKDFIGFIHPEDRETVINSFMSALEQKREITRGLQFRILTEKGTSHWFELNSHAHFDNEGNYTGEEGILRDITQRRKDEEKVKASDDRFRNLLKNISSIAVQGYNMDSTTNYWNKASETIYGYTEKEALGCSFIDLIIPEEMKKDVRQAVHQMAETRLPIPGSDLTLMRKDGSRVDVYSTHAIVQMPDHPPELFCLDIDVTEKKNMEKRLRESEEKYRFLSENSTDGISVLENNNLSYISSGYLSFLSSLGYEKKEIEGITFEMIFSLIHPDDAPLIKKIILEAHADQKSKFQYSFRIKNKKGSYAWVEDSINAEYDTSGKHVKSIINTRDITERKMAEQRILSLLAEKELILKEAHHRIKNDMTTLNSILCLQAETLSDTTAQNALKDAGNRVKSMMILYDKLYKASDFNILSIKTYLTPLIKEIISGFPDSSKISLETHIEEFSLNVKKLQPVTIIINELLTNIMKYAFKGRNNRLVSVSAVQDNNFVIISVQDNGNGLPDSVSFENSTGFGLVLVKMLAEQLNGTIEIERKQGTCIVLKFKR